MNTAADPSTVFAQFAIEAVQTRYSVNGRAQRGLQGQAGELLITNV